MKTGFTRIDWNLQTNGAEKSVRPSELDSPQPFDKILDDAVKNGRPRGADVRMTAEMTKQWAREVQLATQRMLFNAFDPAPEVGAQNPFSEMTRLLALAVKLRDLRKSVGPKHESYKPGSDVDHIVSEAAEKYGLPEKLIHAVIKAESNYNPRALSPVGAQGLMQLMPQTAQTLGVKNAFDPAENVHGGSRYLKELLDHYNGNLRSALAAYNWGPHRVDAKGTSDLPDETRAYLQRIANLLKGRIET
jgi:soluble lytic murein transglycosylase-like protein